MRTRAKMALWLVCCAGCLTACQSRPSIRAIAPAPLVVPGNLTTCTEAPARPGPEATQRDAALIVIDLTEALADCKRKLAAIVDLTTP